MRALRWTLWLFLVVVVIVLVWAFGAISLPSLPNAQKADAGEGVPGVVEVTERECTDRLYRRPRTTEPRQSCSVRGNWTPSDGSATRSNVVVFDDDYSVGDTFAATMFPGDPRIYPLDGQNVVQHLTTLVLVGLGGLALLLVSWWGLIGRYRSRNDRPNHRQVLPTDADWQGY